jgi:ribosomal protein S18 acetylase RimI-like enzyme
MSKASVLTKCQFIEGGAELLDSIRLLWKKLTRHHSGISTHFGDEFRTMPWPQRKQDLLEKSSVGKLRIVIAMRADNELPVGYCVGAIGAKGHAEIESLFVEEDVRRNKIASRLIRRMLSWFSREKAKSASVNVAVGNEGIFRLYERFGFYPRVTTLVKKR